MVKLDKICLVSKRKMRSQEGIEDDLTLEKYPSLAKLLQFGEAKTLPQSQKIQAEDNSNSHSKGTKVSWVIDLKCRLIKTGLIMSTYLNEIK